MQGLGFLGYKGGVCSCPTGIGSSSNWEAAPNLNLLFYFTWRAQTGKIKKGRRGGESAEHRELPDCSSAMELLCWAKGLEKGWAGQCGVEMTLPGDSESVPRAAWQHRQLLALQVQPLGSSHAFFCNRNTNCISALAAESGENPGTGPEMSLNTPLFRVKRDFS